MRSRRTPRVDRRREQLGDVDVERPRDELQGLGAAVPALEHVQHRAPVDASQARQLLPRHAPLGQQRADRIPPDGHVREAYNRDQGQGAEAGLQAAAAARVAGVKPRPRDPQVQPAETSEPESRGHLRQPSGAAERLWPNVGRSTKLSGRSRLARLQQVVDLSAAAPVAASRRGPACGRWPCRADECRARSGCSGRRRRRCTAAR